MGKIRSSRNETPGHAPLFAIPPEIEATLVNWGRWAGARAGMRRHATPLARMALRGSRWDSAAPTGRTTLDVDQAWLAERTICDPMFSPRYRVMLTEHYALGRPSWLTCDSLFIPRGAWEAELLKGARLFWERFQTLTRRQSIDAANKPDK